MTIHADARLGTDTHTFTLANTGSSTLLPLTVGGVLLIGGIAITAYGMRRRRLEN